MLTIISRVYRWIRTLSQRFFLQFGLHCATHQIRVILISCVVITSLFYPALDLYTSSRNSSQSLLYNWGCALHPAPEQDLANLWQSQDTLRVHEDPVARAKCRANNAIRVEHILIQSPLVEDDGALNHNILLSTLDLEQRLEDIISSGDSPCLKKPDGKCLVISPLAFWNYDKSTLLSDSNVFDTLTHSKNVSVSGIPITPQMVLAGRGSYEPHVGGNKLDYATFLALSYFFPNSPCWDSGAEHALWVHTIQNTVSQDAEVVARGPEATLIALDYDPHLSTTKGWSAISAFLYLAYIGFIAYVVWSVKYMDAVHSRLGVTFTALVEIAVSTITSLSVCALVGFKITMVPWEVLPIVIVFVGAENMFTLVDAVGKTSVTLSVKQRIAEGLSRAGTSNTLKVVSYNSILGIIAVFAVGAVRQFCIFAIVVLVAHWFLAHTFFMAVLSIDIARLELEELLRHDTSLVPSVPPKADNLNTKQPRSGWRKLILTVQNLLQGRAATNISLLMLLAIAATLYYTTYTASTSTLDSTLRKPLGAISRTKTRPAADAISIAEHIWKTLNPAQTPLLHLRLEIPTIITFSAGSEISRNPSGINARYTKRTFKFILWILTILVVPIAATTGALYGLLLYLMKNTELLDAQRQSAEADSTSDAVADEKIFQDKFSFSTLPRAFPSDVELIAASKDGRIIVSVGLNNEIITWNANTKKHISVNAADVLLRMTSTSSSAGSTVTSVAVDDKGRYFAVGTGAGLIAVWSVSKSSGKVKHLPPLALENSSAGVTEMQFVPSLSGYSRTFGRSPPASEPSSPETKGSDMVLLATYENGVVARWTVGEIPSVTYFVASRRATVVRSSLLRVSPEDRVLIAFTLDDGVLELMETGDHEPLMLQDCYLQAGNPYDLVRKVHACRAEMNGSMRLVVAAATEAGSVSLWDGHTAECISVLEDAHGRIDHLRVSAVDCKMCPSCGYLPMDSLSLAFSVNSVVQFFKLYLDDPSRRCSCSRAVRLQQQLHHVSSRDSLGKRSRSNSNASSSQIGSPLIPRARLATAFETSAFPISGHGVHSRRASEKDTSRRSSELLTVPFPGNIGSADDYDLHVSHTQDLSGSTTPTSSFSSQSVWKNAVLISLADVMCERGGWGVTNSSFVGIRRKPRSQGKARAILSPHALQSFTSSGLTIATLERWELWIFDPVGAQLRSSLLASLPGQEEESWDSSPSSSPSVSPSSSRTNSVSSSFSAGGTDEGIARLPFTRVSPLLVSSSHALAGFGNTIGVVHFDA
ncbi:Sterol regulatory element-binding protein cleavage-activating protein [Psilocybe cubensis]|uniref:Sterol regulatory element-binding protein cleavage-activating protein n=2 Tax=Psilocybe cubensis TaxID=181762 RepID=A0A8H7Y5T0_PSICU|nr:Sterol regulatory element-binding protein cleavage-activating protein [Psilocybe cubensis]KAH9484081.1 Sterol regulatory element-binding protein cleavage-activating protein [Psilocybe cubensis]